MVGLSAITGPMGRLVATAQNGLEVLRYGGLETGAVPSPFQIVESVPMYRLRRYFPPDSRPGATPPGPPVLMVHPMMMSADMWDVTRDEGAVGILHQAGIDPWVIDFGSPDQIEGGMQRNLSDHVVALSEAIDTVKNVTDRDVHLAGYSQGGMFCYQTAAYRRSKDLASIVAFGSPVDTLAALPLNLPAGLAVGAADFMADHVFSRLDIPGWLARTGFQLLDPIKTAQSRMDFVRQLHDREALLPREQQRRFLASDGYIAWSGPAIAELLKQFIAHNRMMSGGFAIRGDLVTLSDIECPVLAVVGEVDDIGQPASVRGIKRASPRADVYEYLIRSGHFGLVVGSKAATQTWPTVAAWVKWLSGDGEEPADVVPMALQPEQSNESGVRAGHPPRARRGRRRRDDVQRRSLRGRRLRRRQQVGSRAGRRDRAHAATSGTAGADQRPHPHLARTHHDRAGARDARRRVPAVRRARAHLRGGRPPRQQRRARAHRRRCAAGRPRRRADGDQAKRAGRHRGAVPARGGRRVDAARRRSDRRGPARRRVRRDRRPRSPRGGEEAARCGCWSSVAAKRAIWTSPRTTTSSTWRRSTPTSWRCPAGTGPTPASRRIWPTSPSRPSVANSSPGRSRTSAGRCRPSVPRRRPTSAPATPCTA